MASSACGFTSNTFHGTSVSEEHEGVVVDQVKPWLVESGGSVRLCDGKADGVRKALTEWAGSDLDTWSIRKLRMARSFAIYLLKYSCQRYGSCQV